MIQVVILFENMFDVDINGLQFIAIEGGEESFDGTCGSGGFEESLVGENQSV